MSSRRRHIVGSGRNEVLRQAPLAVRYVAIASLCAIGALGEMPPHAYHHRTSLRSIGNRPDFSPPFIDADSDPFARTMEGGGRELNIFALSNDYEDDVISFYEPTAAPPTSTPMMDPIEDAAIDPAIDGAPSRPLGARDGGAPASAPSASPVPPSSPTTMKGGDMMDNTIVAQYHQHDGSSSVTNYDNDSAPSDQQSQQDLRSHIIPVLLTGFASAVLFCALFLICGNQRDRYIQRKWEQAQLQRAVLADDNSSEKSVMVDNDNVSDPFDVFSEEEERSANGTSSNDGGSYWVHAVMRELAENSTSKYTSPPDILPPLGDEEVEDREDVVLDLSRSEEHEDMSLSLVSSLTQSLMGGSFYHNEDVEHQTNTQQPKKQQDLQRASSNKHDIGGEPPIGAAVTKLRPSKSNEETNTSVCSSLTDGTNATNNSRSLPGEENTTFNVEKEETMGIFTDGYRTETQCRKTTSYKSTRLAKIKAFPEDEGGNSQTTESLTESSFTMSDRQGDVSLCTEMKKLEILISSIQPEDKSYSRNSPPEHYPEQRGASVREIFFVPPKSISEKSLGFSVENPSTKDSAPNIKAIESSSSFAGKIYVGDRILRVNDFDASGLNGRDLVGLMASARRDETNSMVKLTVMSNDNQEASVDFGLVEGREEI